MIETGLSYQEQYELAEKTWNSFYPDRRRFDQLEESTQNDWIAFFAEYLNQLTQKSIRDYYQNI